MVNLYSSSILWNTGGMDMVTSLHRTRLVKTVMTATREGYKEPITNKQDLSPYDQGLNDGYYGRFYDPASYWTIEQKKIYKAGFDKAKEY
jgi:hypothetical protein